ncbi:MAG: c-type cytochrome [Pseudomonadota bacterium]
MSKFLKGAALTLTLNFGLAAIVVTAAQAEPLGLGREATPAEVAAWDIDIRPDGAGLPEGRGTVADGEEVFAEQCASCHGDFGEGVDRWPVLAGGDGTLGSEDPVKTIGSYWPYLSTVWDYVHRAMPFGNAQSLSDDEVYAITAYLLYVNDLVDDEEFELSHENFVETRLPNEANFFMDDRAESPVFTTRDACMENCKQSVEITKRALILDVTPEGDEEASDTGAAPVQLATAEPATEAEPAAPEVAAVPAFDADLAKKGEKVFKKCKACHQVGDKAKHRTGPILTGIVGAPMAAVDGFKKYSKVLKAKSAEGAVWDEAALDAFLAKPKKWLKGTKMNFAGLKKETDRTAIIEYLKSVGG